MPDVKGVGGQIPPPANQTQASERAAGQVNPTGAQEVPVGQPGTLGQPTGLPAPVLPGQTKILPDVLAGREPTQMFAAERIREAGGASATEVLLGLNRQPSILGAFAPPPGNSEALRHMTPTMRRTIMRALLNKQRERMRRLAHLLRREHDHRDGNQQRDEEGSFAEELFESGAPLDEAQRERARAELGNAARMLDLLDELLAMQDYTLSQMGTFSQG